MFRTLSLPDALVVVSSMRPEDRACFRAVMGDIEDEQIAVNRWQTDGPAWTMLQDNHPAVIGGVSFANSWLATMWMVGTPGLSGESWRKLLRHTRTVLRNLTDPRHPEYRHRIEAHVLASWPQASRFVEVLGFGLEGTRIAAGRGGEDVQTWAMTGPARS